jgi:hypothetical protein
MEKLARAAGSDCGSGCRLDTAAPNGTCVRHRGRLRTGQEKGKDRPARGLAVSAGVPRYTRPALKPRAAHLRTGHHTPCVCPRTLHSAHGRPVALPASIRNCLNGPQVSSASPPSQTSMLPSSSTLIVPRISQWFGQSFLFLPELPPSESIHPSSGCCSCEFHRTVTLHSAI